MPRKQVTSRYRGTDIFSRRIVITVSRSGVLTLAGALFVGIVIPASEGKMVGALGLILSTVAIVTTIEARHQIRTFRYEMQEKITAQLEGWHISEELPDLRESVEAAFEGEGVEDAATRFLRLSKRPDTGRRNIP